MAVLGHLDPARIEVREIPAAIVPIALDAFARFGKGQGHPAQLNMGDCFAYACARHYRLPLLSKGDDFARTAIESAVLQRVANEIGDASCPAGSGCSAGLKGRIGLGKRTAGAAIPLPSAARGR